MERLKQLRVNSGLTQLDVSRLLGVERSTYVKYERGSSDPSTATLIRLADYFGVTVDYLIGHETSKNPLPMPALKISDLDVDILKKFHALDDMARARILNALDFEYQAIPTENAKSSSSLA